MTRFTLITVSLLSGFLQAEDPQSDYYTREVIPIPENVVLEGGGIAILPDQKVAVASRRGDIWICEGAYAEDLSKVKWTRYATGVHEPLGITYHEGSVYATNRQEITKITDIDGDDIADRYETVNDQWGMNGDYHEYNFGSDVDAEGFIWVTHCLTGSARAETDWRGWAFKYSIDGKQAIPVASGIRSPGGVGFNASGDCFYTDNQGLWNGSSSLKWLKPGSFQGNPTGNVFAKLAKLPEPPVPRNNSTTQKEYERDNRIQRPAVFFPHGIVGHSPTGIITDQTKGRFGPFTGQLLVAEQTHSEVQRVFLEKIKGQYQGAVWEFLSGFECGLVPIKMGEQATLFVAGTNRGWASKGGMPYTFERVKWNGKMPFEMHEVRANKDGFTISFTQPLTDDAAANPANYTLKAWTYLYRSKYGSPGLIDEVTPVVTSATISSDKRSVKIVVDKLTLGHVHHISLSDKIQSASGALWHKDVYYTLNELPD